MALTPLRWIGALIAGCLIISVVILRDEPVRVREPGTEGHLVNEMDAHSRHASALASRLRTLQLLDSLGAGHAPADAPPYRLFHDPALPADTRVMLDSIALAALAPLRDSVRAGIDIYFLHDTVTAVRGAITPQRGTYVDYVLARDAGQRCEAIVRVQPDLQVRKRSATFTRNAAEELLGPCLFYGAFGPPGPHVDEWLRTRGWSFVGRGSWARRADAIDLDAILAKQAWMPLQAALGTGTSIPFFSEMHVDGVGCAAENAEACERTLLGKRLRGASPVIINSNLLYRSYAPLGHSQEYSFLYYQRGFGRREPYLLNDMVRSLGRDRFARFWTSADSVPAAFAKAAGEPLNAWTTRWIRAQYGPVPPLGAGVSPGAAGTSMVLIVLAVLVALGVSSRRQFA